MSRPRKIALITIAALIFGAAPMLAQTRIGNFEGPPNGGTSAVGAVRMTGWVVADAGVRRVFVLVDGVTIGQAEYGQFRPDVADLFPGFPDSVTPGFGYILNATDFVDGPHTVSARAELKDGTMFDLGPTRTLQFANSTHNLRPFGQINQPNRNAQLVGTCDLNSPVRRPEVISGWALDLGVEIGDSGIGYVELLIDGVIISNTRRDCVFASSFGGFTNCYGLRRHDIERRFPFAIDAPNAGFRFALDVGFLHNIGFVEGHHTVTIRSGDISNQVENIDEFPVNFVCAENIGNEPSFGIIESPRPVRLYSTLVRVTGWALDAQGIAHVEVFVDGSFVRSIGLSPSLTRPSVSMLHPGFPDSALPVFQGFIIGTDFSDGVHQLQVIAVDKTGARSSIGESSFIIDNFRD